MATLTLKKIPDRLYSRLKQSAEQHRRSMNSEALVCLEQSLISARPDADTILARARELRRQTAGHRLTDRELASAKGNGRP